MSQLTVNTIQLGQSGTPANNFVLTVPSPQDGTIKLSRGNVGSTTQDVISVNAAGQVSFPATGSFGKILQVVQTVKTDVFTTSSTSFVDVTGLSVSITPTSASNKILVLADIKGASSNSASARLYRDSTLIYVGTGTVGNRRQVSSGDFYATGTPGTGIGQTNFSCFLDTPASTSSVVYKVQVAMSLSGTISINRTYYDTDVAYQFMNASSLTAMEVVP